MASFRDMFDDVKSRFSGRQEEAEYVEDDYADDQVLQAEPEAVQPRVSFNDYYDRTEVTERTTRASAPRSSGLDSLFSSTVDGVPDISADKTSVIPPVTPDAQRADVQNQSATVTSEVATSKVESSNAQMASANENKKRRGSVSLSRQVCVIRPESYEEASEIAKALKLGAVVVLAMDKCSTALSKRFLDFGFGVASALEGHVEAIANNTFAITLGDGISANEIQRARREGLL